MISAGVDSQDLAKRGESLIRQSSNRYLTTVRIAFRAKQRRFDDFELGDLFRRLRGRYGARGNASDRKRGDCNKETIHGQYRNTCFTHTTSAAEKP